jgi:hypothetical protein
MAQIKNWLGASYERHGDSTSKSQSKPGKTGAGPKAQIQPDPKVKATAAKTTDFTKTKVQGESKGGGSSSISTGVDTKGNGAATNKIAKGLMGDGAVKPNQKRGSY